MIYWRADWGDLVMARQKIELAADEAEELSRRARATTVSVRDRRRAEIIVLSAQGLTQQRIAEQLGISRVAVTAGLGARAAPAGRVERSCRARAQAMAAASGSAAGGDAAGSFGAVELPHDGPRRRDLAGQRAAPVGGQ